MRRILAGIALALPLADIAAAADVYRCAVPPGLQAEKERRAEARLAIPLGEKEEGWYEGLPAPLKAHYNSGLPVHLDLTRTPYFVGWINGGQPFGDRIDRLLTCGHSMEASNWTVLVESYGAGFATIDMREALAGQPLPTAEGKYEIEAHSFDFEIAGTPYRYVVTGISVGLLKIWRPDLVGPSTRMGLPVERRSDDPEAVWPVLERFGGVLLSAAPSPENWQPSTVPSVREAAALKSAGIGGGQLFFDADLHGQPVDLRGTPYAYGIHFGVEPSHPGEPDADAPLGLCRKARP